MSISKNITQIEHMHSFRLFLNSNLEVFEINSITQNLESYRPKTPYYHAQFKNERKC